LRGACAPVRVLFFYAPRGAEVQKRLGWGLCSVVVLAVGCGGGRLVAGARNVPDGNPSSDAVSLAPGATGGAAVVPASWGAKGDGVTDDTRAIQAALDAGAGGTVFIPPGRYVVDDVQVRAGTRVTGAGPATVLKQRPGSTYAMSINPGSGGSPDPATNVRGVVISDLAFEGNVATLGFSEHTHLLNLNAVSDVVVERCTFRGWQGDAIYLGSSNVAGVERHNEHVAIRDSEFDGVDADNRNGVSVIDGTDVTIERNHFVNTTRPGMPGAVDVEPNAEPFHRIRDVVIQENRIEGGNEVGVNIRLDNNPLPATPYRGIRVRNNRITKPKGLMFFGYANPGAPPAATAPAHDVEWTGNVVVGCESPFIFSGLKGAVLRGNVFRDCTRFGELGYTTGVRDVLVEGNTFERLGSAPVGGTDGVVARWWDGVQVVGNGFVDAGRADLGGGRALNFLSGTSRNVVLRDNVVRAPTGRTTVGFGANGGRVDASTLEAVGNDVGTLPVEIGEGDRGAGEDATRER
jgi:pectate lyase-like protein